jgi:hypothetical protein
VDKNVKESKGMKSQGNHLQYINVYIFTSDTTIIKYTNRSTTKLKVCGYMFRPHLQYSLLQIKESDNVEYFNYLGSMTTNDARCTRKIKYRIFMAKAAFSKKKSIFTSKLDLNIRRKLVKGYIWNIDFYIFQTLTLRKVDKKWLKSLDMWCWRKMEIS